MHLWPHDRALEQFYVSGVPQDKGSAWKMTLKRLVPDETIFRGRRSYPETKAIQSPRRSNSGVLMSVPA
jgi:hypothetical protein